MTAAKTPAKLTRKDLDAALAKAPLNRWTLKDDKLHREYRFKDFVDAFGFMASVALLAQAMDHHPDWSNVYNRVVIDLTTHDAGGISQNDIELAGKIEALSAGRAKE